MDTIVTPVTVITLDSTRIVHSIKADLVARYFPPVVRLVQYDQSLPVIAVSLMQNGQVYTLPNGAAANIRVHKPDATYVYNPALGCDSTRNIVYFEVTQAMAAANGDGLAIVEIVVDGDIAGTSLITLHFEENPVPEDAIESSDEWETIYELGERIIASTVTPVSTAAGMTDHNVVYLYTGTESGWNQGHMYYYNGTTWVDAGIAVTDKTLTVEGMAADAKTVGDRLTTLGSDVANLKTSDTTQNADISSLKEDITSIDTAYYSNTQDGLYHIRLALTQGVINSSGVENDTGAWLKTANYISVHTGDVYNYVGATKDTNNISLSRYLIEYDATKTFIRRVGFQTNGYTVSSGVSYIRFCIGYGSSTGVTTPPDASYPDITISSNYSPAKIKETVDTVEPFIYKHLYGASQPTITWNDGKTLGSDGNLANNADFITSDFLSASDVVNVEYDLASGETLPNMYVCRYADTDYTTLIGAREKLTSHSIFMYGAKYYRIAIKTSIGNASKISFNEFGSVPHKGKMYALGDSLTQGTWNNSGGSSGAQYARCYIQTVADLCGYDLVNLGDHGSGMLATGVGTGYALKGFIDNNTFTDADLITIAYGINDYIGNKAVGTVNDNVDADTCAGQLKYALSTLTGNGVEGSGSAPYARVVLILPQNGRRAYADSLSGSPTYATEWYMQLENNAGYTLADYRNMIKAVGEYYGVQVLDLNEISPINRGNLRNLLGDGLHPTKVGHVKIGQALASYF